MRDVTVLIAARDAAATIARAIRSVIAQGPYPIVLIDDFSADDTVAIAQDVAAAALTVVRPPRHETLGLTRQTGLDAVATRYTMLLDADDELLPGRIAGMRKALDVTGYEVFADALALHDGNTGGPIREVPIPAFLTRHPVPVRLFERNYLPGVGQIAFRTDLARRVGYDLELHGPEDIDLALRMILAGARFHYENTPGYRMYAYADSVSRDIDNQRAMYRRCLAKFPYETIRALYRDHGEDGRTALWALVSVATFREEYQAALYFLDEIAASPTTNPLAVLEPEGPVPYPEAWRLAFQRGTLLLLLERDEEATSTLEEAYLRRAVPEAGNNLAVAFTRRGRLAEAQRLLRQAVSQSPSFMDARINLSASRAHRITTHPLRVHACRSEYSGSRYGA